MTTNTTKAPRPDTNASAATDPPIASNTPPGTAHATAESDLESRVNVRRVALVAALREHRADMHLDAVEAGDEVKEKLAELARIMKDGVVDGWVSVADTAKRKLERWLKESARHVLPHTLPARTVRS
jgi:hypothetical protein